MSWMKHDPLSRINFGVRRRVPIVLQTEGSECGLACLAMISQYHNAHISLIELRRKFRISLKGMSLRQLADAADRSALQSRAIRLDPDEIPALRLPCIIHWRLNHFVVLESIQNSYFNIVDPAIGRCNISENEFSESFTGIALEIWPKPDFKCKKIEEKFRLRDVVGRTEGFYIGAVQILMIALLLELIGLFIPLVSQWVIDHAITSSDSSLLVSLSFGFLVLILIQTIISVYRNWILLYVGTSVSIRWKANVFSHLLGLPLRYFQQRHLGDVISRFESADKILQTISTSFFGAILDGLMAILTLVMMFVYDVKLGSIAVAAMCSYAVLRTFFYPRLREVSQEGVIKGAKLQSHFLETIRGIRAIQYFNKESIRKAGWLDALVEQVNAGLRVQRQQLFFQTANALLFGLESIAILYVGGGLVMNNSLSIGMLVAFGSYKSGFNSRVTALIDNFFSLKMLQIHVERLADITGTEAQQPPSSIDGHRKLEATLELIGVTFRYAHGEPTIISNATFQIAEGESVAIVGKTGSGKSTLLALMLGTIQPTHGEIRIGGHDLAMLGPNALRTISANVMQDDMLFAGSILENITFWDTNIDHQHIEHCVRICQLEKEISAFPMGLQTLIGDMGSVLSGGQKQRVLLARALYKRPQILLLDEATSSLDVVTENAINGELAKLKITRIIVAHRPSTIASADRIIQVIEGVVTSTAFDVLSEPENA